MNGSACEPAIRFLSLEPKLVEVSRARRFLEAVATEVGFPPSRIFDITVACSEGIANAIEHAPGGSVEVRTRLHPDRLEVEVEGPGEFQPPRRAGEQPHRGLGLPLMASLSDHLALYSGPRGGTLTSLTFYLPGAKKQESVTPPRIAELEENELFRSLFENASETMALFSLVLDEKGEVVDLLYEDINRAGETLNGMAKDGMVGKRFAELFGAELLSRYLPTVRRMRAKNTAVTHPNPVEYSQMIGKYLRTVMVPIDDRHFFGITEDVTEQVLQQRKLESASRNYRALAEHSGLGLALCRTVFDDRGRPIDYEFAEVNERYGEFTGLPSKDMIGRRVTEVVPRTSSEVIVAHNQVALGGKPREEETYEPTLGRWYRVHLYSPEHGYFVSLFSDITERKRAEAVLRDSRDLLAVSMAGARLGLWEMDLTSGELTLGPEVAEVLGLTSWTGIGIDLAWSSLVLEPDRARVTDAMRQAKAGEPGVSVEFRVVRPCDGSLVWLEVHATRVVGENGVERLVGLARDITDRMLREQVSEPGQTEG